MRLINRHIVSVVLALTFLSTVICDAEKAYKWQSNFPNIDLDAQSEDAPIVEHADAPEGSATITLDIVDINVTEAVITADHTTNEPQLHCATDTLVTEYMLSFDGDGSSKSGPTVEAVAASGSNTYKTYDTFLSIPLVITYANNDNDIQVTLHVKASNNEDKVADSGNYEATQTLTVAWGGY
ncbi:MAG: hypothetical protein NTW93_06155 [Phycisphaerae bacterium]|nr:hypothetical protein [Phycisphaerae bacterium]